MTLVAVTELLKIMSKGFDKFYVNTLDNTRERALGVYNGSNKDKHYTRFKALHQSKSVSLLINGTRNSADTEKLAQDLYDVLYEYHRLQDIGIDYIQLRYDEPIFIGCTEIGIFQYVIELTIYYKTNF